MIQGAWQRRLVLGAALTAAILLAAELATTALTAWRGSDSVALSSWLREPDQEQLAEAVSAATARYGWAAGCLWPSDSSDDRFTAIDQLGFQRDDEWVLINTRHLQSGALLLLLRHPFPRSTTGSFNEKSGDGFFCYVPEERPRFVPSA